MNCNRSAFWIFVACLPLVGTDAVAQEHVNPGVRCDERITKKDPARYTQDLWAGGRRIPNPLGDKVTVVDFLKFCARINEDFAESNMSLDEAEAFYTALESELQLVHRRRQGRPNPGRNRDEVTNVRDGVKVSRGTAGRYKVYYVRHDACRTVFVLADAVFYREALQLRTSETWTRHTGC